MSEKKRATLQVKPAGAGAFEIGSVLIGCDLELGADGLWTASDEHATTRSDRQLDAVLTFFRHRLNVPSASDAVSPEVMSGLRAMAESAADAEVDFAGVPAAVAWIESLANPPTVEQDPGDDDDPTVLGDLVSPGDLLGILREALRDALAKGTPPGISIPPRAGKVSSIVESLARSCAQSLVYMTVPGIDEVVERVHRLEREKPVDQATPATETSSRYPTFPETRVDPPIRPPLRTKSGAPISWPDARDAFDDMKKAFDTVGFIAPEDTERQLIQLGRVADAMNRIALALQLVKPPSEAKGKPA